MKNTERLLVFICKCDQPSFSEVICGIFLSSVGFRFLVCSFITTSDNRWQ